jgi:hypothetical protein
MLSPLVENLIGGSKAGLTIGKGVLGATGLDDGNLLVVVDGVTWGGGRARMTDPAGLHHGYTIRPS